MLLAVNMIVRDESTNVGAALDSVRDLADEVVVYDTGSTDDTVEIARRSGARVVEGYWDDDFSRARNAALEASTATWVLPLDADERWVGDPVALRARLVDAQPGEAFKAEVRDFRDGSVISASSRTRVFRRAGSSWRRPVHEFPTGPQVARVQALPPDVALIHHVGYSDAEAMRRRGVRNASLGQAELDRLVAEGVQDPDAVGLVLYDLGRSFTLLGRRQDAVQCFESVRELAGDTRWWAPATERLAALLLTDEQFELVLGLVHEVRVHTGGTSYADWLFAQALFHLGMPAEALVTLRGMDRVVDAAGIEDPGAGVVELRALAAARVGRHEEALDDLVTSMARHGLIEGRARLLVALAGGTSSAGVAELLLERDEGHVPELLVELERAGGKGEDIAAEIRAALGRSPLVSPGA